MNAKKVKEMCLFGVENSYGFFGNQDQIKTLETRNGGIIEYRDYSDADTDELILVKRFRVSIQVVEIGVEK